MKPFSRALLLTLLVLVAWVLGPTRGLASEIRVDSTGGLTTVLLDETDNLDLFLDGNPAGLALLNTRDRFDLASEWAYSDQEGPWGSNKQQILTTVPRYTDTPIKYEGLMLFPAPQWSVQVLSDVFINQGVTVFSNDTETTSQYRGLIRAAYSLPFGALGLELSDFETDKVYDPGLYNPYVGLSSGSGDLNQLRLKGGFVTTFPAPSSPQEPRWQAGGFFEVFMAPSINNQSLNVFYLNSPAFTDAETTTGDDYINWGAELLYDVPSVLRVRFAVSSTDSDYDFSRQVPSNSAYFASVNEFDSTQFQSMNVTGAFKASIPSSETENFKVGGQATGYFYNQDNLRANGTVSDNKELQQIATAFGVGVESAKEYTMGLQWKSLSYTNVSDNINSPGTLADLANNNYSYYQLAFGGEKWISPTWALRMGLVAEEDYYSSTTTWTTTLNLGTGLEQAFGRVDARFWLGQTGDMNNSANLVGLIGAQLATTLFL